MSLISTVWSGVFAISLLQWALLVGLTFAFMWWYQMSPFKQYSNIPQVAPHWFLGNKCFGGESLFANYMNHWNALDGHRFGIYWDGNRPAIFLRDLDLIKKVQVGDFDHFTDLGFQYPEYLEKVGNVFGLADMTGEAWKKIRRLANPPFSVPRLKKTVPLMNAAAQKLKKHLTAIEKNEYVDAADFSRKFFMNNIASVVFGMDIDCYGETQSEFEKQGNNLINMTGFIVVDLFPSIAGRMNIKIINNDAEKFFMKLCKEIVRQRRNSKVETKDVLGNLIAVSEENSEMTEEMMYKTCVQFFTDGYESAAQAMSYVIHHLSFHPDIQEKMQAEIDGIFDNKADDEELEEKDLNDMPYLDQVLSEGLRLGCIPFTARMCTKPWKIPGDNFVIPKGTKVLIPIVGLHYDPKYWSDPYKFDPERFNKENRGKFDSATFQPFGFGPRACLGQNLIKMESKILLIKLLRNFSIKPSGDVLENKPWDTDVFVGYKSVKLNIVNRF